jgi:mannose-6-phosphate isomerase-like protein (cupin superfamily)
MSTKFVFSEPSSTDFDRYGHTGKILPTMSATTDHLLIETKNGYDKSLRQSVCEFTYYVISGSGEFIINGAKSPVSQGDVVVIPPGNIFTCNGHLKLLLVNTPKYYPEQAEELPKDAAFRFKP